MVFKNIDPTQIDREFVVTIEVVPNNVWKCKLHKALIEKHVNEHNIIDPF